MVKKKVKARKGDLAELEQLVRSGEAVVAVVGDEKGQGYAVVYAEDAREELHGLLGVLGVTVRLMARDGVPKVFIVEAVKELLKDDALLVLEKPR